MKKPRLDYRALLYLNTNNILISFAADESGTVESEIKYHELHRKFL